jgi:hypothetical protein
MLEKILLQLLKVERYLRRRPAQTRIELRRQRAQKIFIRVGMHAPHAREFHRFFD